jgi:hypothetical protein
VVVVRVAVVVVSVVRHGGRGGVERGSIAVALVVERMVLTVIVVTMIRMSVTIVIVAVIVESVVVVYEVIVSVMVMIGGSV